MPEFTTESKGSTGQTQGVDSFKFHPSSPPFFGKTDLESRPRVCVRVSGGKLSKAHRPELG